MNIEKNQVHTLTVDAVLYSICLFLNGENKTKTLKSITVHMTAEAELNKESSIFKNIVQEK